MGPTSAVATPLGCVSLASGNGGKGRLPSLSLICFRQFFQTHCSSVVPYFSYLEHFESGQEFSGFFAAAINLKPFQTGLFVVIFGQTHARFANCATQKFGLADLREKKVLLKSETNSCTSGSASVSSVNKLTVKRKEK